MFLLNEVVIHLILPLQDQLDADPLLSDTFAGLAFLVSRRYLSRVLSKVEGVRASVQASCSLNAAGPDEPRVNFRRAQDGQLILAVRKEDLKSTHGYFQVGNFVYMHRTCAFPIAGLCGARIRGE